MMMARLRSCSGESSSTPRECSSRGGMVTGRFESAASATLSDSGGRSDPPFDSARAWWLFGRVMGLFLRVRTRSLVVLSSRLSLLTLFFFELALCSLHGTPQAAHPRCHAKRQANQREPGLHLESLVEPL